MQTRSARRSNSYFRLLKVLERKNVTGWQFWIDRGGTFTDVIGLAPEIKNQPSHEWINRE